MKNNNFIKLSVLACIFASFSLAACRKDDVQPPTDVTQDPCDTCAVYCAALAIQNPTNTFEVFLNDAPVWGNFEACTGDTIRIAMTQDCVANGGQCSQWESIIQRNGMNQHVITGGGSYFSFIYIAP